MDEWYSLRLPPVFSYNVLDYLNDNRTQNFFGKEKQSPFSRQRHNFIYIYCTRLQSTTKVYETIKKKRYKSCSTEQAVLIAAVKKLTFFSGVGKGSHRIICTHVLFKKQRRKRGILID